MMTDTANTVYQLDFIEEDFAEKQHARYAVDVANGTATMELIGEEAVLHNAGLGHAMSFTGDNASLSYLSAVRFDVPDELSKRYNSWRN